jgi:hypothetical protein
MRMLSWRVFLAAALAALPLFVAISPRAQACSGLPLTLEEQVAKADAIVIATLTSVVREPTPVPPYVQSERDSVHVEAAVERVIKGEAPGSVGWSQPREAISGCQLDVQQGLQYLLFLNDLAQYPSFGGGSRLISGDAENDNLLARIEAILAGPATPQSTVVLPDAGAGGSDGSGTPWGIIAAGGAAVVLASGALLLGRRLR